MTITKDYVIETLNEIELYINLKTFADEVNEGWKPNWGNEDEHKWFVTFDHYYKQEWDTIYTTCCEDLGIIYFKTRELAERAIKEIVIPFHSPCGRENPRF